MQQITKGIEPTKLAEYKRKNPTHRYDDLGEDPEQIRLTIRQACLEEQLYLCAYCCRQIGSKDYDCRNEHILPRQHYPQYSFDFNTLDPDKLNEQLALLTNKNIEQSRLEKIKAENEKKLLEEKKLNGEEPSSKGKMT